MYVYHQSCLPFLWHLIFSIILLNSPSMCILIHFLQISTLPLVGYLIPNFSCFFMFKYFCLTLLFLSCLRCHLSLHFSSPLLFLLHPCYLTHSRVFHSILSIPFLVSGQFWVYSKHYSWYHTKSKDKNPFGIIAGI